MAGLRDTSPPVAGVRLPGSGRMWFCDAGAANVTRGDWVALTTEVGEEAGRVVIAPQQVALAQLPASLPPLRTLAPQEVEQVLALAERAQLALPALVEAVRTRDLPMVITGVRFTLDGERAVVTYRGSDAVASPSLMLELSDLIRARVELTYESGTGGETACFGGLGRLRSKARSLDMIVAERFDPPGLASAFAPEQLPRLGSRVHTLQGSGTLISVSTRHLRARVRLDTGEEASVALSDLAAEDISSQ